MRGDTATPLNAQAQYGEYLTALEGLQGRYGLQWLNRPDSWVALSLATVAHTQAVILSGNVAARRFTLGVANAGGSFLTRLEITGDFRLPVDVVVNQRRHVPGLGMDIRFIGDKELIFGRLSARPLNQKQATAVSQSLSASTLPYLETLIFLRPAIMNLSSQVIEFYEKKFNARQGIAYLHDYGLPRDAAYLQDLVERFTHFCGLWETAGLATGL